VRSERSVGWLCAQSQKKKLNRAAPRHRLGGCRRPRLARPAPALRRAPLAACAPSTACLVAGPVSINKKSRLDTSLEWCKRSSRFFARSRGGRGRASTGARGSFGPTDTFVRASQFTFHSPTAGAEFIPYQGAEGASAPLRPGCRAFRARAPEIALWRLGTPRAPLAWYPSDRPPAVSLGRVGLPSKDRGHHHSGTVFRCRPRRVVRHSSRAAWPPGIQHHPFGEELSVKTPLPHGREVLRPLAVI